jgi:hypothetical protein
MPRRYRQLRVRDPDTLLLLPATPLAHRHTQHLCERLIPAAGVGPLQGMFSRKERIVT